MTILAEHLDWDFEPTMYLEHLEEEIKKIEESGQKIVQPFLGRSAWEFIVEDLLKIKGDRARKVLIRILKQMVAFA